jgi:hypothetical protein
MNVHEQQWWWDVRAGRAVPDEERGPAKDLLGPYPSREAAEHWRERHDDREEAWKEQDEAWSDEEAEGEGDDRAP